MLQEVFVRYPTTDKLSWGEAVGLTVLVLLLSKLPQQFLDVFTSQRLLLDFFPDTQHTAQSVPEA